MHFRFDPDVFEEHHIGGAATLLSKVMDARPGHYATLPLSAPLSPSQRYRMAARFKIGTTASEVNFHIKEAGGPAFQVVKSCRLAGERPYRKGVWQEFSQTFTPDRATYSQFMVGASQLRGENNYLAIDYILIEEV
jgi:hypothetical protein